MCKCNLPVGVFDSGVGGISVLRELVRILPEEKFIYFGDSANAPYGTKSHKQIFELTEKNIAYLVSRGVKAVVVACNTATSVCIEDLRKKYSDIPIVGIEPALKPAATRKSGSRVLVMATPLTLREEKFLRLCKSYEKTATIIPLPCPGLMELIEAGCLSGKRLEDFLKNLFEKSNAGRVDAVVLGCTHYPFVKDTIAKLLGGAEIFDGGFGTAKQLKKCLEKGGLISSLHEGGVVFENSSGSEKIIELSKMLLNKNYYDVTEKTNN